MTREEMYTLVFKTFPVKPRPKASQLTDLDVDYWERREIRSQLKGRTWTTVPRSLLARTADAMIFLSPVGFRYYLPAWMILALHEVDVLWRVVSALSPSPDSQELQSFFLHRMSKMTIPDAKTVSAFL